MFLECLGEGDSFLGSDVKGFKEFWGEEKRAGRGEERCEGEDIAREEVHGGLGFVGFGGGAAEGEVEGEGGSGGVVVPGVGGETGEVGWEGVASAGGGVVHGCS